MNYEDGIYLKKKLKEQIAQYIDSQIPVKYHIYDSCTFTVPYDTVARIIAVGRGDYDKESYSSSVKTHQGGGGGGTAVKIAQLKKGEKITITLDDEKTSAAYSDWVISGYNAISKVGGAAEGGERYSSSVASVIVGSDVQLIAGGNGGQSNAISKCGTSGSVKYEGPRYLEWSCNGGGASYFGGSGGWEERYNAVHIGGDGGDGLYGGGNGTNCHAIIGDYNTTYDHIGIGGNGGNSDYGNGGNGGGIYGGTTTGHYTGEVGENISGDGGDGHIMGGIAGEISFSVGSSKLIADSMKKGIKISVGVPGKGGFLSAPANSAKIPLNGKNETSGYIEDYQGSPASHELYYNYPAQIPMVRPIGSGSGEDSNSGEAGLHNNMERNVGVGAVIIELGESEFLKTY